MHVLLHAACVKSLHSITYAGCDNLLAAAAMDPALVCIQFEEKHTTSLYAIHVFTVFEGT
jgi:hypothetical protein